MKTWQWWLAVLLIDLHGDGTLGPLGSCGPGALLRANSLEFSKFLALAINYPAAIG
jgi:hypothetical protein